MIRVALLGCGRISVRHCELLGGDRVAGMALACVCDIRPERAKERGEQWGVPWFTDMREMMRNMSDRIDMVGILTESGSHAEHAVARI